MSRKRDLSKREEIAKQFLLPERQSKINTLLRQDGQAYCICRTSDSSRFMIACDACEEWYHGDCIKISEKEAKLIKQYFCVRCTEEDSTLITRWKKRRDDHHRHDRKRKDTSGLYERDSEDYKPEKKSSSSSSKRCNDCMGCHRTEDCGRCDVCQRKSSGNARHRERCKQRICLNYGGITRKRRNSSSDRADNITDSVANLTGPRQCYGPACTRAARNGSKYCADLCGQRLATNRIYQVLPQRIQEWALSPCQAEDKNIKALDSVRKQQSEVRGILQELDRRHRELDIMLARAQESTIDPTVVPSGADCDEDNTELSTMYCITCGVEIHLRTAVKHMEKCFNKVESQASFGSIFKTRIEGSNMFCDFYNPINRTYCKRLRVLCPEHCKDPKIGDHEVCGCPLVTDVFSATGEFCRAPRKSCGKHFVWEKLRRAEIDLERVRQWLKMDELLERERQIRLSMASRAGVLALLLHSTYNHEVMEEITKASQQDQHAMQEELAKRFKNATKVKFDH